MSGTHCDAVRFLVLTLQNGASLGYKWRKCPPDIEGSCEYIE